LRGDPRGQQLSSGGTKGQRLRRRVVLLLVLPQWRRYARSWQVLFPATEKIGPGAGTCLLYLDGFVSLLNFVLIFFVWIFCLSFLSILLNTSLNVRMLEFRPNTEIPYLDEPVKLVFKLHFSTWDLANIFRTLAGPGEFS